MLPKIKKFIRENKKAVKIGTVVLVGLIILLILYKSLFYSDSEKAIYGARLRNIKDNKFTKEQQKDVKDKASSLDGVMNAKVVVKGRLIKFFITFDSGVSNDDIKARFNDMLGYISDKTKGYYDITFYSEITRDGKTVYPVTGYKHKNKTDISFKEL